MTGKQLLSAFFLVLAICSIPAKAAGSNDDLRSKYQGKVVMLRNFYCGSDLIFNEQGVLQSGGAIGAWTLCRDIRIRDIEVKKGDLRIKGQRIYLFRGQDGKDFLDVTAQEPDAAKKSKVYKDLLSRQEVSIKAQLPPNADDAGIQLVLDKLFYPSEQDFLQALPGLWKCFFQTEGSPALCQEKMSGGLETPELGLVEKVGGRIKGPKPLYTPDPSYSDEARMAKSQGTAALIIVVDPAGQVRWVRVSRPLGMGLDEQAAAAISTWKFTPADRDGTPVAVQLHVEVDFHLY